MLNIEKYRLAIWNTREKNQKLYRRDIRSIRWFILLWIGITYLWGCAQLFLGNSFRFPLGATFMVYVSIANPVSQKLRPPPLPDKAMMRESLLPKIDVLHQTPNFACIILMLLQFALHWFCLSDREAMRGRWYWLYFFLQGILTLSINLIWSDMTITLGLYLVLVIEAISMLKLRRQVLVIVGSYLAVFVATIVWQMMHWMIWMTIESALLLMVFIIGWIILSMQQVHARGELEVAHLQLAAYAMRVEELTLVNERQRLARELHDTLAQDLVGLTLQLERVDQHLDKKRFERARELVQQAMTRARATLAEARSAIDDLRANTLGPDDLLLAVQREIKRFTAATSLSCVADVAALALVPEALCEHVLRAITEGLTNIARHAQAHQVRICAKFHETTLLIEVCDDGIGFDSTAVIAQDGHYGLLGLRERARLVGGHFEVASTPGKGTILRLSVPAQVVKQEGGLAWLMETR
ncbi:MAG TPA: sensor histidine kinase [Ktedonobacteraceae bacterium]|jgi:NarL family two-component system sensor histidine kinase YdfH|nr:sensor histidine kinase [Ktedonobacteraceae bacterium]